MGCITNFRPFLATAVLALGAFCFATASVAAASPTFHLRANLTVGKEMPPQVVKTPKASGNFTATLVINRKDGVLNWRLRLSRLSSEPTVAFIALPATSTKGQVVVQLCQGKRCMAGATRTIILPLGVAKALSTRKGYAGIRTKKNPKGEIRGELSPAG